MTGTILNLLQKYHNVTTIGFYLIKRIKGGKLICILDLEILN